MESIIQLKKSEYDKLIELSNYNSLEIEKRAEELYQEKGTYGINIELDTKQNYSDSFKFYASSYVKDWNGKFPISDKDKRKIVEFFNYKLENMMVDKFGEQITSINYYNKKVEDLAKVERIFLISTVTGWGLAIILTLIALFH